MKQTHHYMIRQSRCNHSSKARQVLYKNKTLWYQDILDITVYQVRENSYRLLSHCRNEGRFSYKKA